MATTEAPIGQLPNGRFMVYWTQTGPASYAATGVAVTINAFRVVEQVATLENDGGYKVSAREAQRNLTPSTNSFSFPVHYEAYACPPSSQSNICSTGFTVPTGASLTAVTFSGIAFGF